MLQQINIIPNGKILTPSIQIMYRKIFLKKQKRKIWNQLKFLMKNATELKFQELTQLEIKKLF